MVAVAEPEEAGRTRRVGLVSARAVFCVGSMFLHSERE